MLKRAAVSDGVTVKMTSPTLPLSIVMEPASCPADHRRPSLRSSCRATKVVRPAMSLEDAAARLAPATRRHRMDVHENARTTPHRRRLMVGRLAAGWTVAAVTASFGVNPKTMRKWCYQHAAEGEASLLYRSSRPHRTPSRLAEEATAKLETLRRQCLPGLPSPA